MASCSGDQVKIDSSELVSTESKVELGFVEKTESWRLRSKFFPSKVGGCSAWLDLKDLPLSCKLQCRTCSEPLTFLMQIYAPFDDKDTFHRTIFIFMCRDSSCCEPNNNTNFIVFRSQLPRVNQYYSPDPPLETEKRSDKPSIKDYHLTCGVCGNPSKQQCSRCRAVVYCSRLHQKLDWKTRHKSTCVDHKNGGYTSGIQEVEIPYLGHKFLLPEYDIFTEKEELNEKSLEKSDEEKMVEYKKFLKTSKARIFMRGDNSENEELEEIALKNDKTFSKFSKVVKQFPDQVLRYDRGGTPLWVTSNNIPSDKDIPPCACGTKRQFEFQIMPQLLNYLDIDTAGHSIDWGVLAVYTCSRSCNFGFAYKEEFLWKQDFEPISEQADDSLEDEEVERSRSSDEECY